MSEEGKGIAKDPVCYVCMYVYTALQQRLLRPCQGITPAGEHQLSQAKECRCLLFIMVRRLRRVKVHGCTPKLHPSIQIWSIIPEKLGKMAKSGSCHVTSQQI
ncbi:hypothetical protein DV515_00003970 [Chloebia gouldiae]|uniref:Uncharacterized protein n=1 Tax=Chloebia gouldiae TaxID=44316 RepID=A0A3L8SRV8_CHLGU|nr:hypothetical protein DV515_00003970 [Chloebia gouldiae]